MPQYRVHKSNIPKSIPSIAGFSFVRVSSNAKGVTLDMLAFTDLPVVKHTATGVLGRRATVINAIEPVPGNPDWVVCTTQDVILPHKEEDLILGSESDWKSV